MSSNENYLGTLNKLEATTEFHDQRLTKLEGEVATLHAENKAIYDINSNVKILAESMTSIKEDVRNVKDDLKQGLEEVHTGQSNFSSQIDSEINTIKSDITDLKTTPMKNKSVWLDKIIWAVVGGALGFLVNVILNQLLA